MGISLRDIGTDEFMFDVNWWNWRALVEEIRRLQVLPDSVVDGLHDSFCGKGLSQEQCLVVADALELRIKDLSDGERILWDGTRTTKKDDGVVHRVHLEKNYSTSKPVIEKFIRYLRQSTGFEVC